MRNPTIWGHDLALMMNAGYVILIFAYGLQKGSFVSMDVFSSRWQPKTQKIVSLLTYLLFFFPLFGLIFPILLDEAITSYRINEVVESHWNAPVWPVNFAILFGVFFLLIQGIAEFLRIIVWLVENEREKIKE